MVCWIILLLKCSMFKTATSDTSCPRECVTHAQITLTLTCQTEMALVMPVLSQEEETTPLEQDLTVETIAVCSFIYFC